MARRRLFARLAGAGRVSVVSAPAGSGKTLLLRSWIAAAGLTDSTAWVSVADRERDPQRFWLAVTSALRGTAAGSGLVRELSAAPDLDGWAICERLLKDLAALAERIWLVVDDVHELAPEVLAQLELLVMRAPPALRFVFATRADVRLGLHRLRLAGELTEIRAADLRFTPGEARELLEAAGVDLPDSALALLVERTEGWVAGLRLAALSLATHPGPERFAAEFSGSERTVAEYLLAEVLERQAAPVRRLLLRTSVAERVNGELADLLTGESGGERILQDLEQAGAFVTSLDARRSWFRYHQLFAGLLQLELRRTAPGEVPALHTAAAGWFAQHGYPVEAIRHAQAARDWPLAARLLTGHWVSLVHGGLIATAHELLAGFPAEVAAADAELSALIGLSELSRAGGSLEGAGRYLAAAAAGLASVPAGRRGQLQVLLTILRLVLVRQRGDLPAVAEEAERLLALAMAPDTAQPGGGDLRTIALINLGIAEVWTARLAEAEQHLEQGTALAHQAGRPYLEIKGLAHLAAVTSLRPLGRSFPLTAERSRQAIELARRHGWSETPDAGIAYTVLAAMLVLQGRLAEAEPWLSHAERTLPAETEPAAGLALYHARGLLELARGHPSNALASFQTAGRFAGQLVTPHMYATLRHAHQLQALVRLGENERAEAALAKCGQQERGTGEMRVTLAVLWLARRDPQAAAAALAPVLDGSAPMAADPGSVWTVQAFLLEAIARDALGDPAAGRALEHALDLAEPDGMLLPFLLHPAAELLQRHARHRTAHTALTGQILDLLTGTETERSAPGPAHLREPLSDSETRVLRYLPTNLTAPEIAAQLYVSVHTVKTHMRHLYAKLGTHHRAETIEQARTLGLLAPSLRKP